MARSVPTTIKVRWGETDAMGIVFYPSYLAWFDHATHELFASSGRGLLARLRDDGLAMPVIECGARFRTPVFAGEALVVTATVGEVRSRSFRIEHRVERDRDEVATGFELRVAAGLGDDGALDVRQMPEDLRAWLGDDQ
jgi:acyl-CoA thioester hydrolase